MILAVTILLQVTLAVSVATKLGVVFVFIVRACMVRARTMFFLVAHSGSFAADNSCILVVVVWALIAVAITVLG
jgi:hypothetical protein